MAQLTATLTLASTTVTTDPLSFTLTKALGVKPPNIGVSRAVATVSTPATLVPSTNDVKYAYVKHMAKKADGTTASTNTVDIQTVGAGAPVRQSTTVTYSADLASGETFAISIDGAAVGETITYATSHANTMQLIATRIASHASVLSATVSGRVITVAGMNPGDAFTLAITYTKAGSTTQTIATPTAASGAAFARLAPEEFIFIPVKGGEGLAALAAGTSAAEGVLLEYAYFTKS